LRLETWKKLANEACINETRKAIEACNLEKKPFRLAQKKQCSHIRLAASVIPPDIATIGLAQKNT